MRLVLPQAAKVGQVELGLEVRRRSERVMAESFPELDPLRQKHFCDLATATKIAVCASTSGGDLPRFPEPDVHLALQCRLSSLAWTDIKNRTKKLHSGHRLPPKGTMPRHWTDAVSTRN